MNRVVLTVGPQGAGKSTYCQQIVAADPAIIFISRDQIFNHYCGDDWRDPYTGAWEFGYKKMWEAITQALVSNEAKLILDCWNGDDYDRRSIVRKLRSAGADWVAAWHFFVPEDVCVEWYLAREFKHHPGMKSQYAEACRRNHQLFSVIRWRPNKDLMRFIKSILCNCSSLPVQQQTARSIQI